jgi:hypothetical protein
MSASGDRDAEGLPIGSAHDQLARSIRDGASGAHGATVASAGGRAEHSARDRRPEGDLMAQIDRKALEEASDPKNIAAYVAGQPVEMAMDHGQGAGGTIETVREDDYKGHHISVRTTYRIEVDGRALDVPLMIDNDGNIHCHSLPNYRFDSTVHLVRQLIDTFPNEFRDRAAPAAGSRGEHDTMPPRREGGR